MSLKARLRIAVALLMSVTAAILCGVYIQSYLQSALDQTEQVVNSVGNQLRSAIVEELQRRADHENPPPATPTEAKRFWIATAETDPEIASALKRARAHWKVLLDTFITDNSGHVLAGSLEYAPHERPTPLPLFSDWARRSLRENLRQIYNSSSSELQRPIALSDEGEPVLVVHLVVSSVFLKDRLNPAVEGLVWIGLASIIASLVLAFALPTFVLNPLERLNKVSAQPHRYPRAFEETMVERRASAIKMPGKK